MWGKAAMGRLSALAREGEGVDDPPGHAAGLALLPLCSGNRCRPLPSPPPW